MKNMIETIPENEIIIVEIIILGLGYKPGRFRLFNSLSIMNLFSCLINLFNLVK